MVDIAKLTEVPLREVWPNEAAGFTPWLAENLDGLSESLGIDLELVQQEAPVGSFSVDILAKDVNENRSVVIENQLEATNHDHLGKVLTYAAGYNADVMVWVVREFRDEHRQALDWLNQRTGTETEFYGVVVRAVKIDSSRPAYVFNVVARPNQVRKSRVNTTSGEVTEAQELRRQFFQRVADKLSNHYGDGHRAARPQSWLDFRTGVTGVRCRVSVGYGQARTALYIDVGDKLRNKAIYDGLYDRKSSIENQFSEAFDWNRLNEKQASLIALHRDGSVEGSDTELNELADWMATTIDEIRKKVVPVLKEVLADLDLQSSDDGFSDEAASDEGDE